MPIGLLFGICVAFTILGIVMIQSNRDHPSYSSDTRSGRLTIRLFGWTFALNGFCGLIGMIIELLVR